MNAFIGDNIGVVVAVLLALILVLLALVVRANSRAGALERRLATITRGDDGRDLGAVLEAHVEKVYAVARRQDELERDADSLDRQARRSVQGVGLVRFNNFEDMGGNQSFAIALVDPTGAGVVISSLHARNQTRIYAKAIAGGNADAALSDEEAQAVRLAGNRALGR